MLKTQTIPVLFVHRIGQNTVTGFSTGISEHRQVLKQSFTLLRFENNVTSFVHRDFSVFLHVETHRWKPYTLETLFKFDGIFFVYVEILEKKIKNISKIKFLNLKKNPMMKQKLC